MSNYHIWPDRSSVAEPLQHTLGWNYNGNRTLNFIETYRKYEDWVHGQPVLKYTRDWRAFRLKNTCIFQDYFTFCP